MRKNCGARRDGRKGRGGKLPQEQAGGLDVPGLATLNGARAALAKAEGKGEGQ